jgi:hypothetical protein
MKKVLAVILLVLWAGSVARAADKPPAADLQNIIEQQLQAFSRDDAPAAYGFAAPLIQQIFPTTGEFMAMVKKGYQPVYRNKDHSYGETFINQQGSPAQRVLITGTDGKRYEALYTFQQQPDGSWKISGCSLAELAGTDA